MARAIYDNGLLQFFVIANMPDDPKELARIIADYNRNTMDIEDMLQKNYKDCHRMFYEKTYKSAKAFKEANPNRAWGSITNNTADYGTFWYFDEGKVIKVIYSGDYGTTWEIENPTGEEVFYPWLREP
jgi:hypothetical protein